jgi:DHA2 family multidrug resistance protein-like MFS transporter
MNMHRTPPAASPDASQGAQAGAARRWWALGALALSVLVVGLDLFVLTLALPNLSADLHASTSDLQWFVDAYSLVLAAALLPAGLLGDRLGRKKLLTAALILFGVASLACAYASSAGELIAARAVLGLAAAAILPLALAVLPVLFTAAERPKAIAIVGGATFLGYPVGPILGGWLLDHFWWGSVFLINIPVVLIAVVAVVWLMPESRATRRARIDLPGVAISSAGLTALTYGVITAGQHGWSDATAVATMAAGIAGLVAFVGWERIAGRRADGQPLVDLSLFRSAGFAWGTILSTMVSFALFGITFAMPQYFLDVRGLDSLGSGIRLLPLIGGLAVGLLLGQRLQSPRRPAADELAAAGEPAAGGPAGGPAAGGPLVGAKALVGGGFAIMAVALAVGTATSSGSGTGFVSAWFAAAGLGLGLALPTAMNAALGALTVERSGSGAALMTAMRQVGATIGVAVLGTVLNSVYQNHLTGRGLSAAAAHAAHGSVAGGLAVAHATRSLSLLTEVRDAFAGGLDAMLWVCAGIAVVAALLAVLFLPQQEEPSGGEAQLAEPRDTGIREAAGAE